MEKFKEVSNKQYGQNLPLTSHFLFSLIFFCSPQKLNSLRAEADAAQARADAAEKELKALKEQQGGNDTELTGLKNKIALLEQELERAESRVAKTKGAADDADKHAGDIEALNRKIHLLESNLEAAEGNLKDVTSK